MQTQGSKGKTHHVWVLGLPQFACLRSAKYTHGLRVDQRNISRPPRQVSFQWASSQHLGWGGWNASESYSTALLLWAACRSAAAGQAGAAAGRSLCCSPPLRREVSKQIPATTETPGFALLNAREHGAHRGRSAMPQAGFAQTAREPTAQPPSEGWGQAALQISRQQPELNPHSDFTHFSSIIHILKSSGRNEEKLRLFWALSAGQVRAPTASKETVTCNTKTIRNKTLVHNLQEKKTPWNQVQDSCYFASKQVAG